MRHCASATTIKWLVIIDVHLILNDRDFIGLDVEIVLVGLGAHRLLFTPLLLMLPLRLCLFTLLNLVCHADICHEDILVGVFLCFHKVATVDSLI